MTGEDMERAIEFLLQSQANFETRLAAFEAQQRRTDEQIAETNKIVQLNAETQTQFIQIVTRHIEAQGEINASLRAAIKQNEVTIKQADARIKQADARIKQADERINHSDTRLDRLEALVERYIQGRTGQD